MTQSNITFFIPSTNGKLKIPYISSGIKAGFPSPAADFDESSISLDQIVVKNKEATFYAKASGTSMINAGIDDGDILVIDRSLEPKNNKIAVCFIDGEFTVKRIKIKKDEVYLVPENPEFSALKVTEDNQFIIWGIVTHILKTI